MNDEAPPPIGMPSQQLSRSKSLNDISNDSQISAFSSDRFINLHPNVNGTNPQSAMPAMDVKVATPATMCMPTDSHIYNQNNVIYTNGLTLNNMSYHNNPQYGNLSFDNSRNLNNNQCSNGGGSNGNNSRVATANVFNLCNPLAMNMDEVTEQIGNFHL